MLKTIFALLLAASAGAEPIAVSGSGRFERDRHSGGTEFYASDAADSLYVYGQLWMNYPRTDALYTEGAGPMFAVYQGYLSRNFVFSLGGGTGFVRIYDNDVGQTLLHDLELIGWASRTFLEPRTLDEVRGTISITSTEPQSSTPEPGTIVLMAAGTALLCVTGYRRRN